MRPIVYFAALSFEIASAAGGQAATRNWIDRYIAAHGHCMQQPNGPFTTQNPMEKPIEEWTNEDLADLKAALDRCDALPEDQTLVSRMWTGALYERYASLVHDQQARAAVQAEAKQSALEQAEQKEASRQQKIIADKAAEVARVAALQRAAEQEVVERKAAEERKAAVSEELKAATRLAEETEARATAARAEAQARYGVEAAKRRAAQAEEQIRNADAQARADRQEADKRFAEAHPDTSALSFNSATSCSTVASAYDTGDAEAARQIDQYIGKVMRKTDSEYVNKGQGGVIAKLTPDSFSEVRALAVSYCRQHQTESLLQATLAMYDGIRGFETGMGAK